VWRSGWGIKAAQAGHSVLFDTDAANLFFQLVASRYELGWIMVTSNLPFGRWGEVFGDEVVADAMIDRLVHYAEVLTLTGDSYRTRARRELLAKDRDK
jgi:DNA replication protein DnaC